MRQFAQSATNVLQHRIACRSCSLELRHQSSRNHARRCAVGSILPNTKPFHSASALKDDVNADKQAHPLGDFYADLLARPIPKESKATADLPTFVSTGGDTSKEERAAKLFGTIKGSGYERRTTSKPDETWQTINGVPIPPRPSEPDNCCMSGCVHCVWDDYREDIEQWAGRLKEAQAKAVGESDHPAPKVQMSRPEVDYASSSMDDDGGGSEGLWQGPPGSADANDLFAGIPVGIREFMNVEKRIRERRRTKQAQKTS